MMIICSGCGKDAAMSTSQGSEVFSENQKQVKDFMFSRGYTKIVELRNAIAHPKPLVSDKFPVEKLAESINLIKDLISTCKHNPGFMISVL